MQEHVRSSLFTHWVWFHHFSLPPHQELIGPSQSHHELPPKHTSQKQFRIMQKSAKKKKRWNVEQNLLNLPSCMAQNCLSWRQSSSNLWICRVQRLKWSFKNDAIERTRSSTDSTTTPTTTTTTTTDFDLNLSALLISSIHTLNHLGFFQRISNMSGVKKWME